MHIIPLNRNSNSNRKHIFTWWWIQVTEIHVYYNVYNSICLIAFIFVIEIDYFFLSVQCFIVLLFGWGLCWSDCRSSFANVHFSPSLFIIIFTLYRFLLLKHRRVYAYDRERYRNTERNRRIERQNDWKTERLKETKTPMEQASEIFMYPSMHSSFNEAKRCSTHQQTR